MASLFYYCGLPGVGKTFVAYKQAKNTDIILDSDELRKELFNDEQCQSKNTELFNEIEKRTIVNLKNNKTVHYVSTGLSMKRRIALLKTLKKHFPDVKYKCVCVVAPLDVCHKRNSARERVVPREVIDRMARQFDPPCENEGWDAIDVVRNYYDDETTIYLDEYKKTYQMYYLQKVKEYGSQHNSYHTLSLYDHCHKCCENALRDNAPDYLCNAALIHDFGKLYTQTYWEKDNYSEAHYPNHAELGSYLALVMGFPLRVAQLVRFHMTCYMDAAAQKAWRERMGEQLWSEVARLHQYDEASH